jgi:hypothetical protein
MDPAGDRLATYQEAFVKCASRIAPARRRTSLDAAVSIVFEEYASCGITLDEGPARMIAQELLRHPLWPFLHPIRARREGWTWERPRHRAREATGSSREQITASHTRFVDEYETLAVRLRGVSEDEAREAVQQLLRELNQHLSAAEVEVFTLGVVDPGWADNDPQRAKRLRQQVENEAAAAKESPETP